VITLAIEMSSAIGSVALLRADAVLAAADWADRDGRSRQLFDRLPALLAAAGLRWPDIELYAVGRGPGSYSGLRAAITAAQGFALPDNRPIHAVRSGAALAFEIARERPARPIAIIGDARREQFWIGIFERDGAGAWHVRRDWFLAPADGWADGLPADAVVATPDERIFPIIGKMAGPVFQSLEKPRQPTAAAIARLAHQRIAAGVPSAPLTPIYMHPAVAARPAS